MKFKKLSIALVASALVFTGCNKSGGGGNNPPEPPVPPVVFDNFEEAANSIATKHNYSVKLVNQWDTEILPWFQCNIYNINDNVIYDDIGNLETGYQYYSGYIKQKDQGIVTFRAPLSGTGIVTGGFAATNLERTVSDVYGAAPDHIFESTFTKDETSNFYICEDFDAIAVVANLAFGEYTTLVSSPENLTGEYKNNKLIITGLYTLDYYDEGEIHVNATVTLTFTKIETTTNSSLESYVANPSVSYTAPTAWDNGIKELFNTYYNGYYPPFINNLSYSWKYGQSYSEGNDAILLEDYCNGNLISDYITALTQEGFAPVSNPGFTEYVKSVDEGQLTHKYSIKMKFYAPTDTDASGMPYSYLFPNGVTSFKFLHTQKTKEEIVNIGLLNQYIDSTVAGWFIPHFNLSDDTRVSGFKDATGTLEGLVLLLKGTNSQSFNIYPDTKEHAIAFTNQLRTYLESKGFGYNKALNQYWYSDDYSSEFRFTDPETITNWTSSSYIQMRIGIAQGTLDAHEGEDVTMSSFTLSGQTIYYTVGDSFSFDGTATVTYSNGTSKDVTSSVTVATVPNMNEASSQEVTISYTEDGATVTATYTIVVNPVGATFTINTSAQTGATITITQPESGTTASAGDIIKFKVDVTNDYNLGTISVTCGGATVSYMGPHIQTREYQFTMPSGNVTISVTTTPVIILHNITYVIKNADNDAILAYDDVISSNSTLPTTFNENSTIMFSVSTKTGYVFSSATIDSSTFTNSAFTYNGLNSDIIVTIYVTVGEEEDVLYGSYSFDRPNAFSNPDYYDRYTIILNEDGTGSYIRENHNADPRIYEVRFTYTVSGNRITFTYVSGDNTSFYNGYRLFDSNDTEIPSINNTGVNNGNSTISVTLVKSGALDQTYTFSK